MKKELDILIIDDLELVHAPIETFLKEIVFPNFQLAIAHTYNLTQAKLYLTQRKYDVVMLDGDVGDGWGYEIIPNILEHNEKVTIISCSNDDDFNAVSVKKGSHGAVNKKYVYDWNDEEKKYRLQKAKEIKKLVMAKYQKTTF